MNASAAATTLITEEGVVVTADDDHMVIQTRQTSSCDHCVSQKGCGLTLMEKLFGEKRGQLTLKNTINAQAGDQVLLSIDEQSLVKASLLAYLLPLILMAITAALFRQQGDLVAIVGATAGLAAGFLIAGSLSRGYLSRHFTPIVSRKPISTTQQYVLQELI